MQMIAIPKAETEILREIIVKLTGPCSIYVFDGREHPYTILVLTNVSVSGSHLMNEIQQQTREAITTTVLVHNVTNLATQQKSQQYFFDQVLRHGQRLALNKANVPYVLNHSPERDWESDSRFWHKCVAVAQFNLQAAKDSPMVEVVLCKIALLNRACVQVALGLIRVFMGYAPNEFGLKYLLLLCGHFTDLPTQVFAIETPEAVKRYKMLCAPPVMLLHWTKLTAEEADFEILLDNCQAFLDRAVALATTELNRLNLTTE